VEVVWKSPQSKKEELKGQVSGSFITVSKKRSDLLLDDKVTGGGATMMGPLQWGVKGRPKREGKDRTGIDPHC